MVNLDSQQYAAVDTDSRQVLCLAGAGSGKTRVLVERIAHLIENKKVSPYEIMACSFTRKASGELRKRFEERVGRGAHHITMGTIHSISLRYLKRFGELIGLRGKNLTVYSEFEENYLLRECAIDLGIYKGKAWKIPKREIDAVFNDYYEKGLIPPEDHPCTPIFNEFISRCRENNSLTYGALLCGFKILLPLIKQYLNLKHIFVDECQDLDLLQWKIFNELRDLCGASLFVVGDIDQSIYSWRGAIPEYLIEHQAEFEIFKIENNYRSCPEIVEAANRLIEHNESRIPRTMKATREAAGDIRIMPNMDTEAIVKKILTFADRSRDKDICFLSRNHFLLKKLASCLDVINFPYIYIGRQMELIESPLFRIFHSFLKLLVNPFDNFSFLLIRDLLGLSRPQYNEIRLKATQKSKSHFQTWVESRTEESSNRVSDFFYKTDRTSFELEESFMYLVSAYDWPEEIDLVRTFVTSWMADNSNKTISDYLDWLATYDYSDEIKEDDSKLKLMSIHQSKGLEFPLVVIIGANEGIIPSKQSIEAGDSEIEGERRLFYVALTRAEDSAVICIRSERKEDERGRVFENPVSRFIKEMKNE